MSDGIKKVTSIDLDQVALGIQQGATGLLVGADKAVSGMNKSVESKIIDKATQSLGLPPIVGEFAKFGIGSAQVLLNPTDVNGWMNFADGFLGCQAETWSLLPPATELFAGDLNIGIDEKGRIGYDLRIKGNPNDYTGRLIDIESRGHIADPTGIVDFFAGGRGQAWINNGQRILDGFYHRGNHLTVFNPGENPSPDDYGAKPPPATGKPPPGTGEGIPTNPVTPTPYQPEQPIDLAGNDLEYYNALKALEKNFDLFDSGSSSVTGKSSRDGLISYQDLDAMSRSSNPEMAKAAKFLLSNPAYFGKLNGVGAKDGKIEINEIRAELYWLENEAKKPANPGAPVQTQPAPTPPPPPGAGTPPPTTGTPPPSSGHAPIETNPVVPTPIHNKPIPDLGKDLAAIINDPNLSIEQKIMMLLQAVMRSADEEMLVVAQEIADENMKRASLVDSKASAKDIAAQDNVMGEKTARLQRLMEKRKSMYELLTTFSSKNHEQAMSAIQNMGRI